MNASVVTVSPRARPLARASSRALNTRCATVHRCLPWWVAQSVDVPASVTPAAPWMSLNDPGPPPMSPELEPLLRQLVSASGPPRCRICTRTAGWTKVSVTVTVAITASVTMASCGGRCDDNRHAGPWCVPTHTGSGLPAIAASALSSQTTQVQRQKDFPTQRWEIKGVAMCSPSRQVAGLGAAGMLTRHAMCRLQNWSSAQPSGTPIPSRFCRGRVLSSLRSRCAQPLCGDTESSTACSDTSTG